MSHFTGPENFDVQFGVSFLWSEKGTFRTSESGLRSLRTLDRPIKIHQKRCTVMFRGCVRVNPERVVTRQSLPRKMKQEGHRGHQISYSPAACQEM